MSETNDLQFDSTVGGYLGLEAGDLSLGEIVHARVVRVVHVVVDGWKRKGVSHEVVMRRRKEAGLRSRPGLGQVSRAAGQPEAAEASAGVSST